MTERPRTRWELLQLVAQLLAVAILMGAIFVAAASAGIILVDFVGTEL